MMKTHRAADVRGERALGLFLDEFFYTWLKRQNVIEDFERIHETQEQIKGTDLLLKEFLSEDGRPRATFRVDEKAQLNYINDPRPTFALEIEFLNYKENEEVSRDGGEGDRIREGKKPVPGWFISKENKTDLYVFVWIAKAKETRVERLVSHDFEVLTIYMIRKEDLKKYLRELSIDDDILISEAGKLRGYEGDGGRKNLTEDGRLRLVRTSVGKKVEEPVNLVVDREILSEIALKKYRMIDAKYQQDVKWNGTKDSYGGNTDVIVFNSSADQ